MVRKYMRLAVLPLAFLVLLAFGGVNGQIPGKDDDVSPSKLPAIAPQVPPPTLDALVTKLEALKKQKAEIEKQENAIIDELKKLYLQLGERLTKLGVFPPPMAIPDIVPLNPGSVPKSK